jgi:hypothetical protein
LDRSLCFAAGSLLPGTNLWALGQRRLHPPSARGLHSHLLEGYAGGEQRRRVLTCNLRRDIISNSGWTLGYIYSNGCYCGEWKTLRVSASIYNLTSGTTTAGWISIDGWLSGGCLTLRLPVLDTTHLGGLTTSARSNGWRWNSRSTQETFYSQDDP